MERLTFERKNGIKTGYWSPAKKEELVQALAAYENTGLEPEQLRELDELYLEKCQEVAEFKQQLKWIPVAERLPEESGNYLVTMVTPGYLGGNPYTNWLYRDADEADWLTDEAGDSVPEQEAEVVAWLPVPESWKG